MSTEIHMSRAFFILHQIAVALSAVVLLLGGMLITGIGQDIPGTGGLTRWQLAEMLVECEDDGKLPEGTCTVDINIRPVEATSYE